MTADLDLRKLRYFVAVAEELHFGRAAARLHIAQPVLSRQIRTFERELGVPLFDRGSRGTTLTAEGRQLLADGRFLLAEATGVQQRLGRLGGAQRTITVGVLPGLLATPAVRAYEAGAPHRRARVVQVGWGEQVHAVQHGDVDVVYAREPFDHRGLAASALLEEPRDALLSSADPLAGRTSLRLADLADRRLLQDPATVPEWYAVATPAQRRASATTSVSTVEEKLELAAAGAGFAVLPRSTTRFYHRPDVRVIPIDDVEPSRVTLIWDAMTSDADRDAFIAVALACGDQCL